MGIKNLKVGDIGYVEQCWSGIQKVKITELHTKEKTPFASVHYEDLGGNSCARLQDIYSTREAAIKAMNEKDELIREQYRTQITDIQSLLQFMMNHFLKGEEYTDNEARDVVIEKAKEFGYEIK